MTPEERTVEGLLVDFGLVDGKPFQLLLPGPTTFSYHHDDGRVWLFDVLRARTFATIQLVARGRANGIAVRELATTAEAWEARHQDLSRERAMQLTPAQILTPMIAVLIDGAHMLIDGHHRVLWALLHQVDHLFIEILTDPEAVESLVIRLDGERAARVRKAGI